MAEWRSEQDQIEQQLAAHKAAERNYLDQGVQLLELAAKARFLYEKQIPFARTCVGPKQGCRSNCGNRLRLRRQGTQQKRPPESPPTAFP